MNRTFLITFALLPVLVIAGVGLLLFARPDPRPLNVEGEAKDLALYREIRRKLLEHFDGDLQEEALRDAALKALVAATGDRYTRLLPPVEATGQELDLKGEFFGIGVRINSNDDGSLHVVSVEANGNAERAGVLAGDVFIAADGVSLLGMSFTDSRERIRSRDAGSSVRLTLLRGGDTSRGDDPTAQRLELDVPRGRIETFSVHDAHVQERAGRRFGYVRVSDFAANTVDPQFRQAVSGLSANGIEGLVLDLRGNNGGRVTVAVDLVDALHAEKDAIVTFTRSTRETNRALDRVYRTSRDGAETDLPLVLLVDESSASAAEIVAGALKDHGRAFLVGGRTYGKGVVQTIFRLDTDPRYSLNITTTQYFTPLGRRVQQDESGAAGGIVPDLEIPWREGERARVQQRLRARETRHKREEVARTHRYWNEPDRMLDAALDVLAGVPVVVAAQ
jgi:carboxyl-terminal processing protease